MWIFLVKRLLLFRDLWTSGCVLVELLLGAALLRTNVVGGTFMGEVGIVSVVTDTVAVR